MTKEITKAIILQELEDKFQMREFAPAKFLFDETVVPTYDIHEHLQTWRSRQHTISVTAIGGKSIKSVPDTERWTIRAYSVIFISGVYTVAGIYILRKENSSAGDFSYLDLTAAQNTSYLRTLPEPVVVEPGDKISVNVDGYTSTGDLTLHIDYMMEGMR